MDSPTVRPTSSETISSVPKQNLALHRISSTEDDHARFARLLMPHLDGAYSLARWITGNGADAEDVVQEASLRAFRAVSRVADDSARQWLLTIVRNTAYSWLRKNRPTAVITVEDLEVVEREHANPSDPNGETPEAALITKADAEQLRAAIAALPAPFRETLVLRDIEGLDYREIAGVTGVPVGTVMSRLARARRKLIAILTNKDLTHFVNRKPELVHNGDIRRAASAI
jgi:RNA polymerase sigma factor (sigma-70 family)